MSKPYLIIPTDINTGLTSVCIGLVRAFQKAKMKTGFYKPISQQLEAEHERSNYFIESHAHITPPPSFPIKYCQQKVANQQTDRLMEDIIANFHQASQNCDILLLEGLVPLRDEAYTAKLNAELIKTLDCQVILLCPSLPTSKELEAHLDFHVKLYGGNQSDKFIGYILSDADPSGIIQTNENDHLKLNLGKFNHLHCVGNIPFLPTLRECRLIDIVNHLNAEPISKACQLIQHRRVEKVVVCARTVPNICSSLVSGTLLVTPGDREDILVAAALAARNGVPLAGILLTTGQPSNVHPSQTNLESTNETLSTLFPDKRVLNLCKLALDESLPLYLLSSDTYQCIQSITSMSKEIPLDDSDRVNQTMESISEYIDTDWFRKHIHTPSINPSISPPAFRYYLVNKARKANKSIVLPEGEEPRTIQAAISCSERNIAHCILLGEREKIEHIASGLGLSLPPSLTILKPEDERHKYINEMVELRKHKQLTSEMAAAQLEDNVVLGTMMLTQSHVDGLVSGAIHTTASTIRPALQLIKTHSKAKLVSSIFFMCLPDQVLVYADCAVNPDPSAEELADIAIQSAQSAQTFGISVKVALISYSTGSSGQGIDVEKVREATKIAQERAPHILIDGPLQYDAAINAKVGKQKAPNSPVAGQATVLIFPDLNTGNTTYKAVQRSANVVSMGPMLQGLKKPVNDLSRGALVEDIIYTIALTAIQSDQSV